MVTKIQKSHSHLRITRARGVRAAFELTLPPLPPVLELTDTLGRTGLGIESDTTKSLNYHGTMRLDPPKQIQHRDTRVF